MSRAHRIGNIYTRVEGLIRKNHLKEADIPLWFDVYKQFPPKYDPNFKREEPEMSIRKIFYKEDTVRSKAHKVFKSHLGAFDFQNPQESVSQSLLKSCMDLISQGMSEDEAIEKVKGSLKLNEKKESKDDAQDEFNQTI